MKRKPGKERSGHTKEGAGAMNESTMIGLCVCELKNICLSPVCDQEFEPCSAELNWCRNIGKDGNECAHDEACHQQQETT